MSFLGIGLNGYGFYSSYSGYNYASFPANTSPVPSQTGAGGVAAGAVAGIGDTGAAGIGGTGAAGIGGTGAAGIGGTGAAGIGGTGAAGIGGAGAAGIGGAGAAGRMPGSGEASGIGGTAVRTAGTSDMQMLKRMGAIECKTCKNRTYQDGSDDPGVSFKAPGHIDPASSQAVVRSHEQEHVMREQGKAKVEGRRVVSQSVTLSTAICPECGRVYVSGGLTRTTTAAERRNPVTDSVEKKRTALASAYKSGKATTGRSINKAV